MWGKKCHWHAQSGSGFLLNLRPPAQSRLIRLNVLWSPEELHEVYDPFASQSWKILPCARVPSSGFPLQMTKVEHLWRTLMRFTVTRHRDRALLQKQNNSSVHTLQDQDCLKHGRHSDVFNIYFDNWPIKSKIIPIYYTNGAFSKETDIFSFIFSAFISNRLKSYEAFWPKYTIINVFILIHTLAFTQRFPKNYFTSHYLSNCFSLVHSLFEFSKK